MPQAHTIQEFQIFISQLLETNAGLDFWVDFPQVAANVADVEISLNALNFLIGKTDLALAVNQLWARDPRVFDVLPILIACRKRDNKKVVTPNLDVVPLASFLETPEQVVAFLKGTGLAEVLRNSQLGNLVDYVFGVEVGLDTNARKNRSGTIMEARIAKLIRAANLSFRTQVSSNEWPAVARALGADEKRFDFLIETPRKRYLLEVNFYSGGGSKLNEVARSYTELAPKINAVPGFEFVWVTDGVGWLSAKSKMQEAFCSIPAVFNLTTFGDFLKRIAKE